MYNWIAMGPGAITYQISADAISIESDCSVFWLNNEMVAILPLSIPVLRQGKSESEAT